jgi:hypothetical protein
MCTLSNIWGQLEDLWTIPFRMGDGPAGKRPFYCGGQAEPNKMCTKARCDCLHGHSQKQFYSGKVWA